jgi:hypothetical protein
MQKTEYICCQAVIDVFTCNDTYNNMEYITPLRLNLYRYINIYAYAELCMHCMAKLAFNL